MHTKYYFTTVEIKDYHVLIDGQNLFDQPVKSNLRTNDNNWKIAIGQGDEHTTGCLSYYSLFNNYYKKIDLRQ